MEMKAKRLMSCTTLRDKQSMVMPSTNSEPWTSWECLTSICGHTWAFTLVCHRPRFPYRGRLLFRTISRNRIRNANWLFGWDRRCRCGWWYGGGGRGRRRFWYGSRRWGRDFRLTLFLRTTISIISFEGSLQDLWKVKPRNSFYIPENLDQLEKPKILSLQ